MDSIFQPRVTSSEFQIFYEIYVSSYLTAGKSVCICSERSGFCFSIFQLRWDTKQNKRSWNVADTLKYTFQIKLQTTSVNVFSQNLRRIFLKIKIPGKFDFQIISFLLKQDVQQPSFLLKNAKVFSFLILDCSLKKLGINLKHK